VFVFPNKDDAQGAKGKIQDPGKEDQDRQVPVDFEHIPHLVSEMF